MTLVSEKKKLYLNGAGCVRPPVILRGDAVRNTSEFLYRIIYVLLIINKH
jgi:hypothetical protein